MIQRFGGLLCLLVLASASSYRSGFAQDTITDGPWRYRLEAPQGAWQSIAYDDASWQSGMGGFGTRGTPASRIGTVWRTKDIWLRRKVELTRVPAKPALYMHHDEDADVFINGVSAAKVNGYSTDYQVVPLSAEAAATLKTGTNTLALHCKQTGGGQYIDVHIVDADKIPQLPEVQGPTTPFKSQLITRWGKEVTPDNAWREYPRPALAREVWQNLNGTWKYAITPRAQAEAPNSWSGDILVPFCLESKLGRVQRLLSSKETLWYQRTFNAAAEAGKRAILNFEAVDYRCRVWLNGKLVGEHVGGNDPFSLDVTDAMKTGSNELIVRVEDDTEAYQLNGKQHLNPEGIWYTQVSGIWQTVWLEQIPTQALTDLKITTDAGAGSITVRPIISGKGNGHEKVKVSVEGGPVAEAAAGSPVVITVPNAKLWSPADPHLYQLTVSLVDANGKTLDQVRSYAGIRSVGKAKDSDGNWRLTLNGKEIFHWGPLDQGWWPDGLLTPPSDAAMQSDIRFLKDAGFNMIRKHIKVEPRRYYYHCDRIGMLLWQDQVSAGHGPAWTRLAPNPRDAEWSDEHHAQFMHEFEEMVSNLENHPCIVIWTPFNEAWGQHRTVETGKWIQQRDPTRLVNIASGGNFWPVGDIADEHQYPHPGFPFNKERYADYVKVVGEFGGHGLPIAGHIWDADRDNWGYGGLPKNAEEYRARYLESLQKLAELKQRGISAGVYTQTTDVEGEINGLLTYDREVQKIPAAELKKMHEAAGIK
ncbi:MAG: glycoside hydrolase family 2 TIM barrel-domain containing protein [Pirellulales bacterium]